MKNSKPAQEYLILVQDILGWINVDIIYGAGGEEVECVEVVINCQELCQGMGGTAVVAMNVPNINSAFELTYDPGSGTYKMCGVDAPLAIGGLTVYLIIIIECRDGSLMVAIITVTITNGYHTQTVNCPDFVPMDAQTLAQTLKQL